MADGGGLHLLVAPSGSKTWRWRYKVRGPAGRTVEKLLTLETYPAVSIAEARRKRDLARGEHRAGNDPGKQKRLRRISGITDQQNGFEAIARAWHSKQIGAWSERHAGEVLASLNPAFKAMVTRCCAKSLADRRGSCFAVSLWWPAGRGCGSRRRVRL